MNAQPRPSQFKDFDAFCNAFTAHAIAALPPVTRDDSRKDAIKKSMAIADAEEQAMDIAYDKWIDWIEHCEEMFERGIGPGWE
jgi:hypothetical protein